MVRKLYVAMKLFCNHNIITMAINIPITSNDISGGESAFLQIPSGIMNKETCH